MRVKYNNLVNKFCTIIHAIWRREYTSMLRQYPDILDVPGVNANFIIVNGITDSPHPDSHSEDELMQNELTTSTRHEISSDGHIVVSDSYVLMHRYHVLRVLSDCDWIVDIAAEHIRLGIRHELGHIVDHAKRMGATADEHAAWRKEIADDYKLVGDIPDNPEDYWKWQLKYYNLPVERRANELASITLEDIAVDFAIMNPGYDIFSSAVGKYISLDRHKLLTTWLRSKGYYERYYGKGENR